MNEAKIAEQLFDRVKKIEASGNHVVDPEKILKSFEHPDSVIHQFCRGCGVTLEVNREVAGKEASQVGISLPQDIEKEMYFESQGCEACDEGNKSIKLKKIELQ